MQSVPSSSKAFVKCYLQNPSQGPILPHHQLSEYCTLGKRMHMRILLDGIARGSDAQVLPAICVVHRYGADEERKKIIYF